MLTGLGLTRRSVRWSGSISKTSLGRRNHPCRQGSAVAAMRKRGTAEGLKMVSHWRWALWPLRLSMCTVASAWLTKPWRTRRRAGCRKPPMAPEVNFMSMVRPGGLRGRITTRDSGLRPAAHSRAVAGEVASSRSVWATACRRGDADRPRRCGGRRCTGHAGIDVEKSIINGDLSMWSKPMPGGELGLSLPSARIRRADSDLRLAGVADDASAMRAFAEDRPVGLERAYFSSMPMVMLRTQLESRGWRRAFLIRMPRHKLR